MASQSRGVSGLFRPHPCASARADGNSERIPAETGGALATGGVNIDLRLGSGRVTLRSASATSWPQRPDHLTVALNLRQIVDDPHTMRALRNACCDLFPSPYLLTDAAVVDLISNRIAFGSLELVTAAPEIAWGAKVSAEFKEKVISICFDLGFDPSFLMAAMAFESGETFSPNVVNSSGSGAVGLIQFMPDTAKQLGATTAQLSAMTAEQQLDFVKAYFLPHSGKLQNIEDVYMAILFPAAIGKPDTFVLFDKDNKTHPKRYTQNKGLDANRDGVITKAEAAAPVKAKLTKGLSSGFIG